MHHSISHIVDETDVRHIKDVKSAVHDTARGETIFAIELGSATSVFTTDPVVAREYFAAIEKAAHELVLAADRALAPKAVAS